MLQGMSQHIIAFKITWIDNHPRYHNALTNSVAHSVIKYKYDSRPKLVQTSIYSVWQSLRTIIGKQ